ncbi:MAG: nucleotidyltransferase domain-containing protein [Natronospirillum sp.]
MTLNQQTGLTDKDLALIRQSAADYPDIEALMVFGSRAKGNYRKGSDVDIAVVGKLVKDDTLSKLTDQLNEELPMPYFFDVVHYNTLPAEALKEHIDRVGLTLYQKNGPN